MIESTPPSSKAEFTALQLRALEQQKLDAAADGYQALLKLEELDAEHKKKRKILLGDHYKARQLIIDLNHQIQRIQAEASIFQLPSANGSLKEG